MYPFDHDDTEHARVLPTPLSLEGAAQRSGDI